MLHGLHMQTKKPQDKFLSVLKGKVLDVVVDLRKNSKHMENTLRLFSVKKTENICLFLKVLLTEF